MGKEQTKTEKAWAKILDAYPIMDHVSKGDVYEIKASEIKKYREPRLMTKFDTSDSVVKPLKAHGLNVLPTSRSSYVIGEFDLYEEFPDMRSIKPECISLPDYETLRVENITSESNAINALTISGALQSFLGEEEEDFIETFNGRMGTGDFSFDIKIGAKSGIQTYKTIDVNKAQLEIDGGFESRNSVTIIEAKNIRHDDFNIRQLYFPYRKYHELVNKPIRLVFSQYTNLTYYLYEYRFTNLFDFSSIDLVKRQAYTFEDSQISMDDLSRVWRNTVVVYSDNQNGPGVPFIQADKLDRVIALAERLEAEAGGALSVDDVADFLGMVNRQANYYSAAGEYLGLLNRSEKGYVALTKEAEEILGLPYRDRQLAFVELILRHEIFHELFKEVIKTEGVPDKDYVVRLMGKLNVCNPGDTARRRASSVLAWLNWMLSLPDEDF